MKPSHLTGLHRIFSRRLSWRRALCVVGAASGLLAASGRPAVAQQPVPTTVARSALALPERLSDAEFWTLVTDISEPGGYFRITDNFTSNEMEVGRVMSRLRAARIRGGAYIGVGPEQNFSYIAAIRPDVAFVIDIRRQAVIQHLLFKAVFELSPDRAAFIAMLFSRSRPPAVDSGTPVQALWNAFASTTVDSALAARSFARITDHLVRRHGFALNDEEHGMLRWVWDAFTRYGPAINTQAGQGGRGGAGRGTFALLTGWSMDTTGEPRSFLATEDDYRYVRDMHLRNMIVPVSGDFAGPRALRGIGAWLSRQGATVSAYYVSNVEQYLFQDDRQGAFYANVATLPLGDASVFIRPYALRGRAFGRGGGGGTGTSPGPWDALCPIREFLRAYDQGRVTGHNDALSCGM